MLRSSKRPSARSPQANPPKRATLKEVAKAAGVSLASASYAVNGTGSLGEATRDHILHVADKLGYRQNLSARAMRTGKTGAIGLVLPDLTNPFFPTLAQSVIQTARQHLHSVFVTDTEGSPELEVASIRLLVERGVDGIVWFPVGDHNTAGSLLTGIPTVVVDRTISGLESIQADYAGGGRLAAEHLIESGHTSIGIVSGPTDVLSMRQRCDAAASYIQEHAKLAFRVTNAFSTDLEPKVKDAIRSRAATAVFVGADLIALGVMQYAQSLKIKVPAQLSVIGFDDVPWAQFVSPALTTVDMPLGEMAAEAVEALLRRSDDRPDSRRKIVFDTTLVQRDSVQRVAKR
jgi:LacI family transcriptional regulator, galactose operon repressor